MNFFAIMSVFAFFIGSAVGSFLNVVIYRLPLGRSVVRPRSACPGCNAPIAWYDNIPIFSWVILGAKCRRCKTPISIQYPLIELLCGTLALACFMRYGVSIDTVAYFLFCAGLVAATFIDLPYQIIPDEISIGGTVLGLAVSPFTKEIGVADAFLGAGIGFFLIAGIILAYYLIRKTEGMGMGDAKLLAMIGAFLGWQSLLFVLVASSIQGLVASLVSFKLGWMKKAPPLPDPAEVDAEGPLEAEDEQEVSLGQAAVPFGPFLALAALEWLFFRGDIASMYLGLLTGNGPL